MLRRWHVVIAAIVMVAGTLAIVPAMAQDDPLDGLAEGDLQDQVRWFVDLLDSGGAGVSQAEIAEHFSPAFLAQIPAEDVLTTVAQLQPVLGDVTVERIASGSTETDAGFVLVGNTGVRVRVTLWIEPDTGLIAGLVIEPDLGPPASPGASPAASPSASPAASPAASPTA